MGSTELRGRRFVVGLYLGIVTFAAVAGVLFARVVENPTPPSYLFVIQFPPTELGFALYGALTVATVLGVPLALIAGVAARVDDDAVAPPED